MPLPLLYLSAFFEATRADYYGALFRVTERGAWEEWLTYFLNGVARQSEDALSRSERINRTLDQWRERATERRTHTALRILDLLAANPYLTIRKAESQLGVAYNTAATAIRQLESMRIIRQVGDASRDRVFCAQALLDILEEPPRLRPSS